MLVVIFISDSVSGDGSGGCDGRCGVGDNGDYSGIGLENSEKHARFCLFLL